VKQGSAARIEHNEIRDQTKPIADTIPSAKSPLLPPMRTRAALCCTLVLALKAPPQPRKDRAMAKKQQHADSVYRIVDVVGVSEKSWEDAGRHAVETAAGSLRDLRVAEVTKMDMKVEDGKVTAFRTRVALSFKYEA